MGCKCSTPCDPRGGPLLDIVEPHCWEGRTSFSQSAWFQGNSARVFRSSVWAQAFIKQVEAHRTWAPKYEPRASPRDAVMACLPATGALSAGLGPPAPKLPPGAPLSHGRRW